MNWILLAFVGVALLCPITMFGPMLLERLGLRKRSGAGGMSCMGMHDTAGAPQTELDGLRAQRDAIDREIAFAQTPLAARDEPPRAQARSAQSASVGEE